MQCTWRTLDFLANGCSCKTGCHSKRCGCRKKEQSCGAGCECHGCTNLPLTSLQQQNNMDEDEEIENETEDESENNSEEDESDFSEEEHIQTELVTDMFINDSILDL